MFEKVQNFYLKKKSKRKVLEYYERLGLNPTKIENETMNELLEKVDIALKTMDKLPKYDLTLVRNKAYNEELEEELEHDRE